MSRKSSSSSYDTSISSSNFYSEMECQELRQKLLQTDRSLIRLGAISTRNKTEIAEEPVRREADTGFKRTDQMDISRVPVGNNPSPYPAHRQSHVDDSLTQTKNELLIKQLDAVTTDRSVLACKIETAYKELSELRKQLGMMKSTSRSDRQGRDHPPSPHTTSLTESGFHQDTSAADSTADNRTRTMKSPTRTPISPAGTRAGWCRTDEGIRDPSSCSNLHPTVSIASQTTGDSSEDIIQALQTAIIERNSKIVVLEERLSKQQRVISMSKDLDAQNQVHFNNLQSEMSMLLEQFKSQKGQLREKETQISGLHSELSSVQARLLVSEQKLSSQLIQAEVNDKRLEACRQELENTFCLLTTKEGQVSELRQELQRGGLSAESVQLELMAKVSKLEADASRAAQLEHQLEQRKQEVSNLESSLRARDSEVGQVRELVQRLRIVHNNHCKDLETQITVLNQEMERRSERYANTESSLAALGADHKEKSEQLLISQRQVQRLEAEMLRRLNELDELRSYSKDSAIANRQLTDSVEALRNGNEQLVSTNLELTNQVRSLEAEVQRLLMEHKCEKDELASLVDHLAVELQSREVKMGTCLSQQARLEEALTSSQSRVLELQLSAALIEQELAAQREASTETLRESANETASLRASYEQCQLENQKHLEQVAQLLDQVHKSQAAVLVAENTTRALQDQAGEHSARREALEQKLAFAQDSLGRSSEELEKMSFVNVTLQQKLRDALNDASARQREVQVQSQQLSKLDRALKKSTVALAKMQRELDGAHWEIQQFEDCKKALKLELEEAKGSLDEATSQLKREQGRVLHLEQVVQQLQKRQLSTMDELSEARLGAIHMTNVLDAKSCELEKIQVTSHADRAMCTDLRNRLAHMEAELGAARRVATTVTPAEHQISALESRVLEQADQLQEAHLELVQRRTTEEALSQQLVDLRGAIILKEAENARLAREIGALQMREAQGQARHQHKLWSERQAFGLQLGLQQDRLDVLHQSSTNAAAQQAEEELLLRSTASWLQGELELREKDLLAGRALAGQLQDDVRNLKVSLAQREETLRATQHSLLLKDAEIARLEARISCMERSRFLRTYTNNEINPGDTVQSLERAQCTPRSEVSQSRPVSGMHALSSPCSSAAGREIRSQSPYTDVNAKAGDVSPASAELPAYDDSRFAELIELSSCDLSSLLTRANAQLLAEGIETNQSFVETVLTATSSSFIELESRRDDQIPVVKGPVNS